MANQWGAVLTAMVTPFDDRGALDLDAAAELARWLQDHGNDGLVVAGTTGEAPVLTESEKLDLWRAVSEAVTIPIVAGTGSNNTAETVELTRKASAIGVAGVLVVGPYYNRPPQAGIEAHFRATAAATDLPVMIYDVPPRTGRRIARDVLVRLFSDVTNLVAFK
ncbi:MAG: 4-hydroxy-tetrahydrodipicolinate synthase, partial [Acidimicrobiaceae bacterium]